MHDGESVSGCMGEWGWRVGECGWRVIVGWVVWLENWEVSLEGGECHWRVGMGVCEWMMVGGGWAVLVEGGVGEWGGRV